MTLQGSFWADQNDIHNEVIMTSHTGAINWPHKGIRSFIKKILIFILVKEIVLYTRNSQLEAPLVMWDIKTVPYQFIL